MTSSDQPEPEGYASPACLMHEVSPAYLGGPLSAAEVARWRKAERARLIAQRLALPSPLRMVYARRIARYLDELIGTPVGCTVGCYWPIRGEPNLRPWLVELQARGVLTALPVVVAKATPLTFRLWQQGDELARGVWDIPEPVAGAVVRPDIVIAPLVGFDRAGYRLGYGGGFFDRTLATLPASTVAIGVGYAETEITTIHPQPFDIRMSHIVTDHGAVTP